jgi:hypothetical protein
MSNNTEINNSDEWINCAKELFAKKQIKYYEYERFDCIQEIGFGSLGKVYRANMRSNRSYLVLKSFFNFKIIAKEIVNEVNKYFCLYDILLYFMFLIYNFILCMV